MQTRLHLDVFTRLQSRPRDLFIGAIVTVSFLSLGCVKNADGKKDAESLATEPRSDAALQMSDQHGGAATLPRELVAVWIKAGADDGWVLWHGFVDFRSTGARKSIENAGLLFPEWQVPGFRFSEWTDGTVTKLPQPQQSFGLSAHQHQGDGFGAEGTRRAGTTTSPLPLPKSDQ